ncbi:hypothetical protein EON79_16060 [bacterium]|nr:MAG: hypothetical protein EON79_16060 [bacterium]
MGINEFFSKGKGPDTLAFDGHLIKGKITGPIHVSDNVLYNRDDKIYRKVTKISGEERTGRTVHF